MFKTVPYKNQLTQNQRRIMSNSVRSYLFSVFQGVILQVRFAWVEKLYALHRSSLKSPNMDRWKPLKRNKTKQLASPSPQSKFKSLSVRVKIRNARVSFRSRKTCLMKPVVILGENLYLRDWACLLGRVSRRKTSAMSVLVKDGAVKREWAELV